MRILGERFVDRFRGRLLNIHPSLLPNYRGLHTHARALEAGDAEHGASVHFVIPELDAGAVIAQAPVPVIAGDTAETLAARVLQVEHPLLVHVARLAADGRLLNSARCRNPRWSSPVYAAATRVRPPYGRPWLDSAHAHLRR